MRRLLSDYGIVLALLALCLLFSVLTIKEQVPEGRRAARQVVKRLAGEVGKDDIVLAVGADGKDSGDFARYVGRELGRKGFGRVRVAVGTPRDLRVALDEISDRPTCARPA